MDPFVPALEELSRALASGEDPEPVLAEIAEEHGLAAHALRNRAVRAFGPLETYKERQAALKQERQRSALRSARIRLWPEPRSWLRWQTSAPSCRKRSGMHRSSAWPKSLGLIRWCTEARSVAFASGTKDRGERLCGSGCAPAVHRPGQGRPGLVRGSRQRCSRAAERGWHK